MRIAYFDTIAGIAGDMTLAAFVSAGVRLDDLTAELRKLNVNGYDISARHVRRSSIDAVQIDVTVSHATHIHRDLHGIMKVVQASALPPNVKANTEAMFRTIAEAEARVHNTTVENVHFHEVGALDSIVDIVGTAVCLEILGIGRVYSSPVRLGRGGMVSTQHGPMPTPAPATLEILKGYPVVLTDLPYELTTPTGAAIIKALSHGVLDSEQLNVSAVGYGAGTKEFQEIPNFMRVIIGTLDVRLEEDHVAVIETNIDDMNPQMYPALIEKLLAAGAHDAYLVPIIMKKGRPGILLSVMAPKPDLETITSLIYRETSTIGLRIQEIGRKKLPRRHLTVNTSFGPVAAKAVLRDGVELLSPEFEECKRIAGEHALPVLDVMRRLEQELRDRRIP